ncbi:MAG: hypothetical protein VZR53_10365 [Prevotella sp.]|nr:hypothetical protein [Prevotella sp.]
MIINSLKVGLQTLPLDVLGEFIKENLSNRNINPNQVNRITCSLREMYGEEGNFNLLSPIILNKATGHLIDGQHRWESLKNLTEVIPVDIPINVLVVNVHPDEELQKIIDANTNSKNWSMNDFLKAYKEEGNNQASYKRLEDFCSMSKLLHNEKKGTYNYRYGACCLKAKPQQKELKDGLFTVTDEEVVKGLSTIKEVEAICNALNLSSGHWMEYIITQWVNDIREPNKDKKGFVKMFTKELSKSKYRKEPKSTAKDFKRLFGMALTEVNKVA